MRRRTKAASVPSAAGADLERVGAGSEEGLTRTAAAGVLWQGSSYVLSKLVVLVMTVALARLLAPRDFGVFTAALVFIAYSERLADLGVAQALVFLRADRRTTDAAVVATLVTSLSLVGIALVAAPTLASFFHRPDVTPIFRVLSLSLLLRGTGNIPDALLRKHMMFRQRLKAELARAVAMAVVSVALAAMGFEAWALVWGYLAGDLAWNVGAWILVDYRPRWGFWRLHRSSVGPLVRFGLPAAGQGVLLSLVYDIDYLIVGRMLGPAALGFYTVAYRIPQSTIIPAFWALSAVAFPMFARVQDDPARVRRGYLAWMRIQTTVGLAAGVGLSVLAPLVVNVAFGSRWSASIVPLQALALYAALRSLTSGVFDLYKGIGRPVLAFWLSAIRLAVVVPALIVGTRYGIDGVSWAQVVAALVLGIVMQATALHVLGIPVSSFVAAVRGALAMAVGIAVCGGLAGTAVPGPDVVRLLAGAAAAGLGGLALLHLADRRFLVDLIGLLRRGSGRGSVSGEPA